MHSTILLALLAGCAWEVPVDPDADVVLNDMTGTQDHWEARIVAASFEGMSRVARQRAIYGALGELMHGPIHALSLQTITPEQAQAED